MPTKEQKRKNEEYRKILGLKPGASEREIRQAYFKKSLEHHPDKGGKTEVFQKICAAYCSLKKNKEENNIENTGDRDSRTNNNSQSNSLEIETWRAENPTNSGWEEAKKKFYSNSPFVPPFPNHEGLNHGKNPRKVPSVQERIKELEEEIAKCKKKFNLSLTEGQRREVEDYINQLEELLGLFKNELCENREEQLEWEIGWLKRKKPDSPQRKQELAWFWF
ncbi:MAG: Chaperone protein DnaJ [Mycoplasmataceae bacterium]|nr:MAG: Chaperone protein DnaJ [Mycoplasmataceae bacterium]